MSQGGANSNPGSGANPIETLTGNSGGAVGPDGAMNVDILGNNPTGIDVVGTPASSLLTIIGIQSSETQRGTVELATAAETTTGISTTLAVHPSGLNTKLGPQTSNGLIYGQGGAGTNLGALAEATDGQIPIGSTGNPPTLAVPTSTGSTITISGGAGTLNFDITAPLSVPNGGTGATSLTDHGLLVGSGAAAITALGAPTTGQLLTATTGSDPAWGNSSDGNFTFTTATAGASRGLFVTNTDATGASDSSATIEVQTQAASIGDPRLRLNVNGGQDYSFGIDNSDSDSLKINDDLSPSAGNNLWKMTSGGERTMPLQPAFLGYLNAADLNVTGNATQYTLGTNTALTEVYDQNGDFNTNGTFTAPVTGKYDLKAFMEMDNTSMGSAIVYALFIVTSNNTFRSSSQNSGSAEPFKNNKVCALADMDAMDTAVVQVLVSGIGADTADIAGGATLITYFCGTLTC